MTPKRDANFIED